MADDPNSNSTVILSSAPPKPELHQNALPIGTMLGEFEIIDLIGEGGFGIVYLAQDHSLHRKVALKEYMPASLASRGHDASVSVRSERQRETFGIGLRSFVNEARILAQFDHPALVKVYRFWEANGTAYMVMPFFSGRTLQDTLRERDKAPDEVWIRKILSPVMDALELIHRDQIYHRDIAPDNIMLLADDRPVLLDFGAARRVISDMTQALTVILKPGYAPIEQYAEMPGMKQGPWTDVYALAAVVYFMILNRKPPPAVGRMMQDSYEPLALSEMAGQYSDRFLQGIDRCLNVKAEDRPQSMAEMREAIGFSLPHVAPVVSVPEPKKAAKTPPPPKAVKTTAPPPVKRDAEDAPARSKMPMLGAVGAAALAIAGGAYFYISKRAPEPAPTTKLEAPAITEAPKPAVAPEPAKTAAASSAPATVAPPAPTRYASLTEALTAATGASDAQLAIQLNAPATLTAGSPLKLTAKSKADGFLYVFVWDESENVVYRLLPSDEDSDNAVKANASFAVPHAKDGAVPRLVAKEPLGTWQIISVLSEKPRDFAQAAFVQKGDFASADRKALEGKLGTVGLAGIFGSPRCADAQPCEDRYAVTTGKLTELAAPVAKPAVTAPRPAPATQEKPAKSKPDSEREYMKRLNKDLDTLLGR